MAPGECHGAAGERQGATPDQRTGLQIELHPQLDVALPLVQALPQSDRVARSQPALRSLQRGVGLAPGRLPQPADHLLHVALGVLYPERRTGLYFVPLFTLLGAAIFKKIPKAGACVAALLLAQFAIDWNVTYYDEWLFDAANRDAMRYIVDHAPRPCAVAGTFPQRMTLEFYKRTWRLDWLQIRAVEESPGDLYVLGEGDAGLVQKRKLRIQYQDPRSKLIVAAP